MLNVVILVLFTRAIHFDNCIYPKIEVINNYIKPEEELSIIKLSEILKT